LAIIRPLSSRVVVAVMDTFTDTATHRAGLYRPIGASVGTVIGEVFYTDDGLGRAMSKQDDKLTKVIAEVINKAKEPLETTEVMEMAATKSGADISRPVLFYRLNNLRAEGAIHGKQIGSGKGNWVWWGEGLTSE